MKTQTVQQSEINKDPSLLIESLLKRVQALEQYVEMRKKQQLEYPLDKPSQGIVTRYILGI